MLSKQNLTWHPCDIADLKKLIEGQTPIELVALQLGRTQSAVMHKLKDEKIKIPKGDLGKYKPQS